MKAADQNDKEKLQQFATMTIGDQKFGISVDYVVDVLFPQKISSVPLASPQIVGLLNLRGRIVTALDIRVTLDIESKVNVNKNMCIVVEYDHELFSILVDKVGDVATVSVHDLIKNPDNLSKSWQQVSLGIFPMENELVVILDLDRLMTMIMETK